MQVEYCARWADGLCLPSDQWAAWVQAVGSLLALAVAIGVPVAFHVIERREKRSQERTLAHLAGTRVLFMLEQMGGVLQSLNAEISDYRSHIEMDAIHTIDHSFFFHTLESIGHPQVQEMVALHSVGPKMSIALANGVALYTQVLAALQTLHRNGSGHNFSDEVAALSATVKSAEKGLSSAYGSLKAFIEDVERRP